MLNRINPLHLKTIIIILIKSSLTCIKVGHCTAGDIASVSNRVNSNKFACCSGSAVGESFASYPTVLRTQFSTGIQRYIREP